MVDTNVEVGRQGIGSLIFKQKRHSFFETTHGVADSFGLLAIVDALMSKPSLCGHIGLLVAQL